MTEGNTGCGNWRCEARGGAAPPSPLRAGRRSRPARRGLPPCRPRASGDPAHHRGDRAEGAWRWGCDPGPVSQRPGEESPEPPRGSARGERGGGANDRGGRDPLGERGGRSGCSGGSGAEPPVVGPGLPPPGPSGRIAGMHLEFDKGGLRFFFFTAAIRGRQPLLSRIVPRAPGRQRPGEVSPEPPRGRPPRRDPRAGWDVELAPAGEAVAKRWREVHARDPFLTASNFVLMPDHTHLLLLVDYRRARSECSSCCARSRERVGSAPWRMACRRASTLRRKKADAWPRGDSSSFPPSRPTSRNFRSTGRTATS